MSLLVVDDSRTMRRIVVRTLRQAGFGAYPVREAADGRQALAAVAEQEPRVVLSDWNMPELDGLGLLRTLRAAGCSVPFGFVTCEGTLAMRHLAEESGAQFLVPKPFRTEDFTRALAGLLP